MCERYESVKFRRGTHWIGPQLYDGNAEPGYNDGPMVTGDWNNDSDYVDGKWVVYNDIPGRLAHVFERMGFEVEWSDEWTGCSECGKAIRTQPNSYSWTRSYVEADGEITCCECALKDPEAVLESFEDDDQRACTLEINPAMHGYVLVKGGMENGWYGGQDDDPRVIADALRKKGITRFMFTIDSVGQFDLDFSCWVHESEADLLEENEELPSAGDHDPAEVMKQALKDVHILPPKEGHIVVTKIDSSTGEAKAKYVTSQDFIDGKALD